MAGERTVGEIVDAIIIAIFFIIFVSFVGPYLTILSSNPSSNTLGNLVRIISDAYENGESRYPLKLSEANDYSLFGKGLYIIQVENFTGIENYDSKNRIPITKSCEINKVCICTLSVRDCQGSKPEHRDWEKLNFYDDSAYSEMEDIDLNVITSTNSLKDYTKDFLTRVATSDECESNDEFIGEIIYCMQTNDKYYISLKSVENDFSHKNIVLFPTDKMEINADIIELKLSKTNLESETGVIIFEQVIKLYNK